MVCHHLAKFGGHRYCSSRDITFLVCHVIKQGHVIKGSGDYINRCCLSTSTLRHHPAKFGGHRHCSRGDIMVLVCFVISQDHIIRGSCYFIGRRPSRLPSCQVSWP